MLRRLLFPESRIFAEICILMVLFGVVLLMAQNGPAPKANKRRSKDSKDVVTMQGCVGLTSGDYILMQLDPGNSYKLEAANRRIKLGPHLGEQVEVTGWESASLGTSSDYLSRSGVPTPVTIMVTSISTIEKECTSRVLVPNPVATPVPGAQLEVSSTPNSADIEIDGNFVGQTTSTVGVSAGQHQLIVKKNGYKPWEKTITISSGQVRVHAALEMERK